MIIARFAHRFFWRRARLRQRRRNCLSLRISSGSSIASMPHARSPNRCGSLSDRALRPWPEAAVLLIFVRRFHSLRRTTVQSNAARFPRLNVPRFVAIARPPCIRAFPTTLLGGSLCQLMLIAPVAARLCWAPQPCWHYLMLCRLQALKISLHQMHRRRRKLPRGRRRLHRLLRPSRSRHRRHRHQLRRRPHHKQAVVEHNYLKSMCVQLSDLCRASQRGAPRRPQ
jgi:hypothetical protein